MADSPSDWPAELGELKTMDTLLRCPICYEFVRTAVTLARCMHSFCSVCIRRYLSSYQKNCPQCHMNADENELVVNRLLDEQVKLFQSVRSRLLVVIRAGLHALPSSLKSPQQMQKSALGAKSEKRPSRLLRLPDSDDDGVQEAVVSSQTVDLDGFSVTGSEVANSRSHPLQEDVPMETVVAAHSQTSKFVSVPEPPSPLLGEELKDDGVFSPAQQPIVATHGQSTEQVAVTVGESSRHTSPATQPSSALADNMEAGSSSQSTSSQQTLKKAPCPVCNSLVPVRHIHAHLDRCLVKQADQDNTSRSVKKRPPHEHRPKPRLVYTLLSDKALKRHLKDCGLNTSGPRQVLIRRHQEFTLRYNSECDAVKPKSAAQIIKELEDEEKARSSSRPFASLGTQPLRFDSHQNSADKDKLRERYARNHSNHFRQLIKEVRQRPKKSKDSKPTTMHSQKHVAKSATPSSQPKRKFKKKRMIVLSDEEDSSSEIFMDNVCDTTSSVEEQTAEDNKTKDKAGGSPVGRDLSSTESLNFDEAAGSPVGLDLSSTESLNFDKAADSSDGLDISSTESLKSDEAAGSPVWLDTSTTDLPEKETGLNRPVTPVSKTRAANTKQSASSQQTLVGCEDDEIDAPDGKQHKVGVAPQQTLVGCEDDEIDAHDGKQHKNSSGPVAEVSHDDSDFVLSTSQGKRTPSRRTSSSKGSPGWEQKEQVPSSTGPLKRKRKNIIVEDSQLTDPDYAPSADEMMRVLQQAEAAAYKRCLRTRK